MSQPKQVSQALRLDPELMRKVAEAALLTGLSKSDILRLCLAVGLEDLRKVEFNLARVVSEAAERKRQELKVADDVQEFRTGQTNSAAS